ncbi:hypothetical protein DFH09DRAFT_1333360 [Mycena vulgaris]|nr:hypothetical protein DFH09DRAFT_1333360 [Mycena vulgaris]
MSPQINRLELHLTRAQFLHLRPLHVDFPILTHLATSPSLHLDLVDLMHRTPSLRVICLLYHRGTTLVQLIEGCEDIQNPNPRRQMQLISTPSSSSLPHLNTIEIDDVSHGAANTEGISAASIPQSSHSFAALSLLTLPNLRRLELHADLDLDVLTSFLSRGCVLDRLIGGGKDLRQQAQIIECLNHFPCVKTLQIKHSLRVDGLIRCLRNPSLLPGIQNLTIAAQNAVVGYKLLIKMLQCRLNSTHSVCVYTGTSPVSPYSALFILNYHNSVTCGDEWPRDRRKGALNPFP